jgi:hypothetical protein
VGGLKNPCVGGLKNPCGGLEERLGSVEIVDDELASITNITHY